MFCRRVRRKSRTALAVCVAPALKAGVIKQTHPEILSEGVIWAKAKIYSFLHERCNYYSHVTSSNYTQRVYKGFTKGINRQPASKGKVVQKNWSQPVPYSSLRKVIK